VASAAAVLRDGGVIALPTDTVYGLAAAIDRPAAIDRLFRIKGRPESKAIPILLSETARASLVASPLPPLAAALAARFWPGGLTIVVPARSGLPSALLTLADGEATVGIRVPAHPLARAIIAAAGGALAVTSANRSGEAPALTAEEVHAWADPFPDLVIDGGRAPGGVASTVVQALSPTPTLLRAGAIAADVIVAALGDVELTATRPGPPDADTV
jgi:L-threonylcarbamoyladenylate synthase